MKVIIDEGHLQYVSQNLVWDVVNVCPSLDIFRPDPIRLQHHFEVQSRLSFRVEPLLEPYFTEIYLLKGLDMVLELRRDVSTVAPRYFSRGFSIALVYMLASGVESLQFLDCVVVASSITLGLTWRTTSVHHLPTP